MAPLTVDSLVSTICDYRRWRLDRDQAGNLIVEVCLPGDTTHRVNVFKRRDLAGSAIVIFMADVCSEQEIDDPTRLLRECGFMNHGVFAVLNGRLVVMDTQIDQTADIEEVAAIMTHIASYASRFLKKLSIKKDGRTMPPIGQVMGGTKRDLQN